MSDLTEAQFHDLVNEAREQRWHCKVLTGGVGVTLVLDRREVIPDDPGAGDPAVVYIRDPEGDGYWSATLWCAADTGEVDTVWIGAKALAWIRSQTEAANEFLYRENDG